MPDAELTIVSASVKNWSAVPPDASITFLFNESVDVRSAQSGIRLVAESARAHVRPNGEATEATWTLLSPLPDGEYTLRVEGVTSADGVRSVVPYDLNFTVLAQDHPGSPYGHVVLHRSRTKLRMSERQYAVSKLLDPQTGKRYEVAVDEQGQRMELDALVLEDRRAAFEKYGKIHPALFEKLEHGGDAQRLPVGVWIAVREDFVDKSRFEIDPCDDPPERLVGYRETVREALKAASRLIRERCEGSEPIALEAAPLILAELTPSQIRQLGELREVSALFLHEREGIDDIRDSMKISGADYLVNVEGWRATGVRVGVWEDGADDTSRLVIQDQFSARALTGSIPGW